MYIHSHYIISYNSIHGTQKAEHMQHITVFMAEHMLGLLCAMNTVIADDVMQSIMM